MKILILRVSAIGDVVHTLPSIFLIKNKYPNAKISWVVQKKAADILKDQPYLENIWILPNKFLKFKNWPKTLKVINKIRKTKWDAILDFQGILKTSALLPFLSGKKYGFDKENARLWVTSWLTNKHTKPVYQNIIQKNLALTSDMLQKFEPTNNKNCPTIQELKKTFFLNFSQKSKAVVNKWISENKIEKLIAIAPNTTWLSKEWPSDNWARLLEKLTQHYTDSKTSIVLVGKDFGKQAQDLANYIKHKKLKVYIAPKWDLLSTSYLIQKSSLLIAPDTGLLHIADFLQIKTIGIFGPTSAKKHGPFLLDTNIKNAIQIKCPHYYQKTHGNPKEKTVKDSIQANCMYKLSQEDLFEKILTILNG